MAAMAVDEKASNKSLEIVCRIAPKREYQESCISLVDDRYVKLIPPASYNPRNNDTFIEKIFKFDYVFDENDTQRDVFRKCALDFVENLVSGNDSLLFTYGVTGSGKTFTMAGNAENDNSGMLPRTLDVIFRSLPNIMEKCVFKPNGRNGFIIQTEEQAMLERLIIPLPSYSITKRLVETVSTKTLSHTRCCAVFVSYIEIYNDMCYDLLDETLTEERLFTSKNIRIDYVSRKAYVEKIKEIEVESCDEAIEQFLQAQERRKIAKTLLNKSSSRSHSIFTIRLVSASLQKNKYYPDPSQNDIHVAEMSLVDLAGSERAKRTQNVEERLTESNKINQSLLALRQCFERLRDNQRTTQHLPIPYRDSKLTFLFKSYFEGFGRIRMIVCVNPQATDFEENLHVMAFAKASQEIKLAQQKGSVHVLQELNNLPFNRRDISQWNKEFAKGVGKFQPLLIELFEQSPVIEIADCNDEISLSKIREYYTKKTALKRSYMDTVEKNMETLAAGLKSRLCFGDLISSRNAELLSELDGLRAEYANLNNNFKQLKRTNNSLKTTLSRYEASDENDRRREEENETKVRQKNEALAKQRRTLQKLEELLDTPVLSSRNHVAKLRQHFDTPSEVPTKLRPRPRETSTPPSRRHHSPPKSEIRITKPYMNQQYHRRSRSAGRVLDHQPMNHVPSGTIFQTKFPSSTVHTKRLSAENLKKCTDYVVTKQTADKNGNLRTELVKGVVTPTAGGGSAVRFNDIEVLHHKYPA
uniref:Kinesin-like protein n=1 Tax=Panagrolaimus superbus TaxID=310955 RepID=A0A914YRB3_9BILA